MIDEDELNIEETIKLQNDERFTKFKKWCLDNGAVIEGVQFPAAFGPLGVPGIAADEDIPPNKVIVAIPNNLIISDDKVYGSELEQVLDRFPELFDEEKCGDSDFNILAIYLMYEKMKGEESFWHPYFELNQRSYTLLDWCEPDLARLEDPYILQELACLKNEMEKQWRNIEKVVDLYPQFFPKDKVCKGLFFYCYELCMTRGYGWTLPSVCLVPLADMFNHHCDTTTHYVVNTEFESHPEKSHPKYRIKKHKINLALMGQPELIFPPEEIAAKNLYAYRNKRKEYVRQYREYLSEESQAALDLDTIDWLGSADFKKLTAEINLEKIKRTKEPNVFAYKDYGTTNSEDNDTSDEEKVERKSQNDQLKKAELDRFLNIKVEPKQPKKPKHKNWSEDVLLEEEHDGVIMQIKQLNIKVNKPPVEGEEVEEWESCDSSSDISDVSEESDFSWYDDDDHKNYFSVTTIKPEKKGQQLYNCYGQRTNRFLLMWYGFCFSKNRYDSYSFRLWMNLEVESLNDQLFEKIVFQEYLANETCSGGFVWKKKQKVELKDLTQEFRLKKTEICIDLIIYLRLYLMMHYKGPDYKKIIASLPISPIYEAFVLAFAVKLLSHLLKRYSTTILEDQTTLLDTRLDYRARFAITYRVGQKQILEGQIKLLQEALLLLTNYNENLPLIENILKPIYPQESEFPTEIYINRQRIKPYLQQLYESTDRKIFTFPKQEIKDILK